MDSLAGFSAFLQVVLIDISLAADNALIVGMAAAGLPKELRHRAIMIGIGAATVLRIVFAIFAVQLLNIIGLTLAGGLMLLWVAWKLFHAIRHAPHHDAAATAPDHAAPHKSLKDAVIQIIVADVSMSLDNVLAVAGAARDHLGVLIMGLALSVVLMGVAATAVVRLLHRFHWIGYAGLLVVLYVALSMIWEGWHEVSPKLIALI